MPTPTDDEPIHLSCDHWMEFTDTAINLTGIPDDQFRSVDADGNPIVETESMDYPLISFDDLPISTSGGPDDEGAPPSGKITSPGVNGTAHPPVPPRVPPKSV